MTNEQRLRKMSLYIVNNFSSNKSRDKYVRSCVIDQIKRQGAWMSLIKHDQKESNLYLVMQPYYPLSAGAKSIKICARVWKEQTEMF
jgi:hypothetical protein